MREGLGRDTDRGEADPHSSPHTCDAPVLDGRAGGHHHASADGVNGVRGEAGQVGDAPSKDERGEEVVRVGPQGRLERVVQTEVQAAVNDNADARDDEAAVQAGDSVCGRVRGLREADYRRKERDEAHKWRVGMVAWHQGESIVPHQRATPQPPALAACSLPTPAPAPAPLTGGEGLAVHVNEAVELALAPSLLGGLGVVGQAGTGVVKRVDEGQRAGAGGTSRGEVA